MTQTLTTERLREIASSPSFDANPLSHEVKYMARELLANREAQPVAGTQFTPIADLYAVRIFDNGSAYVRDAAEALRISKRNDNAEIVEYVHIKRLQDSYTAPPAVPRVTAIPESATLTNINQLCPLDNNLSQTDFATGWNDCRQYAITNDGVPPVAQGWHSAAQGWNACRATMLAQPVSQGCVWTYDEHDYKWDSGCGEAWMFSDGGPTENGVKFCQSCGKPVLLAAAPEGGNG